MKFQTNNGTGSTTTFVDRGTVQLLDATNTVVASIYGRASEQNVPSSQYGSAFVQANGILLASGNLYVAPAGTYTIRLTLDLDSGFCGQNGNTDGSGTLSWEATPD